MDTAISLNISLHQGIGHIFAIQFYYRNQDLKKRGNIQRPVAMVLMFVLLLSMAPKTYFHDLVARHKDVTSCREKHTTTVLHNNSYHCHFNNLVVSVPFIKFPFHLQLTAPSTFVEYRAELYNLNLTGFSWHPENRGPPAI